MNHGHGQGFRYVSAMDQSQNNTSKIGVRDAG